MDNDVGIGSGPHGQVRGQEDSSEEKKWKIYDGNIIWSTKKVVGMHLPIGIKKLGKGPKKVWKPEFNWISQPRRDSDHG
jgi:hypothetical protein